MRHGAARFSFVRADAGSDHIGCNKPGPSFAASVANSFRAHCFTKIESAICRGDTEFRYDKDSFACNFRTISGGKAGAGQTRSGVQPVQAERRIYRRERLCAGKQSEGS